MAAAFDITPSAAFKRAADAMATVSISEVVVAATMRTASESISGLRDSAKSAGASRSMVGAVTVLQAPSAADLVMRQRAEPGDIMVGVSGHSDHAEEADDLEWGGVSEGPRAWVRNWHSHNQGAVNAQWSDALTTELTRRLR